jgi:hypothetical protein
VNHCKNDLKRHEHALSSDSCVGFHAAMQPASSTARLRPAHTDLLCYDLQAASRWMSRRSAKRPTRR